MTKPNGHANGAGNQDDGKVTSLDEARRRAAQKAKTERRIANPVSQQGNTARSYIIGGLMLAMAIAGLASFFFDMTGGVAISGATGGGMQ